MTIRSICGVLAIASGLIGHILIVIGSFMFNVIANDLNHSYYEFAISSSPMKAIVLVLWILILYGITLMIFDIRSCIKQKKGYK